MLNLIEDHDCELNQHDSFMPTSACLAARDAADKQIIEEIKIRDWS